MSLTTILRQEAGWVEMSAMAVRKSAGENAAVFAVNKQKRGGMNRRAQDLSQQ
jgi:hypothetical protein